MLGSRSSCLGTCQGLPRQPPLPTNHQLIDDLHNCTRRAPRLVHVLHCIPTKRHASHATSLASRHRQPAVPRQQAECTHKTPVPPLRRPKPFCPSSRYGHGHGHGHGPDSRDPREASVRACVRASERKEYEAIGRGQVADGDAAITILHDERRVWYEACGVDFVSRLDDGLLELVR